VELLSLEGQWTSQVINLIHKDCIQLCGQHQVRRDGALLEPGSWTEVLQLSREKPCVAAVLWDDGRTKQPAQES
jgi:hypothetical protein